MKLNSSATQLICADIQRVKFTTSDYSSDINFSCHRDLSRNQLTGNIPSNKLSDNITTM